MKVLISPKAQGQIKSVFLYICNNLKNPTAAKNTVNGIYEEIKKLETSPFLGTPIDIPFAQITNLYSLRFRNYYIVYRLTDCIKIELVFYTGRNFDSVIQAIANEL